MQRHAVHLPKTVTTQKGILIHRCCDWFAKLQNLWLWLLQLYFVLYRKFYYLSLRWSKSVTNAITVIKNWFELLKNGTISPVLFARLDAFYWFGGKLHSEPIDFTMEKLALPTDLLTNAGSKAQGIEIYFFRKFSYWGWLPFFQSKKPVKITPNL